MTGPTYATADAPIREAILDAHRNTWRRIANAGTWFDGPTRVAIAAESRNAPACALCAERKAALSPYGIDGTHDSLGDQTVVRRIFPKAQHPNPQTRLGR